MVGCLFFTLVNIGEAQHADHKVVLLTNDSVMEGEIESLSTGYRIKSTNGITLTISNNDIAAICNSFDEIYELKQFAILPNQPEKHLELARWCLKYDLFPKAKHQVDLAGQLIGEHTSVVMLRRQIDVAEKAASKPEPKKQAQQTENNKPGIETKQGQDDITTLNGRQLDQLMNRVPDTVMENYTRYIQPLVVNGCTVSGCHLSNKNEFQLSRRSLNSPVGRRMTQRNLVTMIRWANRDHIESSELLQKAATAHGEMKEAPWHVDSRNYLWLKTWISQVQQHQIDLGIDENSNLNESGAGTDTRQANHVEMGNTGGSGAGNSIKNDFVPSVPTKNGSTNKQKVADPFDPSEFNKRYFGKSKKFPDQQ